MRGLSRRLRRSAAARALPLVARLTHSLANLTQADDQLMEAMAIRRFNARTDDIYIASFPKSGATLLQMMLYQLTTDGAMNFPHIQAVAPSLDEALMRNEQHYIAKLAPPRLLKTHWRWETLEPAVTRGRCVYIARHPGDVLMSAYNHRMMQLGDTIPFDDYVEKAFLTVAPFGGWADHTRSWWPHRSDPNVLFLRYETITQDLASAVEAVADFCGIQLTSESVSRIEERCSLDYMKRHWTKFDPRLRTLLWDAPEFIRTGRSGAWSQLPHGTQQMVLNELTQTATSLGVEGETLAEEFALSRTEHERSHACRSRAGIRRA